MKMWERIVVHMESMFNEKFCLYLNFLFQLAGPHLMVGVSDMTITYTMMVPFKPFLHISSDEKLEKLLDGVAYYSVEDSFH